MLFKQKSDPACLPKEVALACIVLFLVMILCEMLFQNLKIENKEKKKEVEDKKCDYAVNEFETYSSLHYLL